MFGHRSNNRGVSPLAGGIAGTLLQNLVVGRVARAVSGRRGGAGGFKGMLIGMAATYALNRFLGGHRQQQQQQQPAPRRVRSRAR